MSIPKWHEFMAPVLRAMSDGANRDRSEITEAAADQVALTIAEREVTLTTGQPMYANRVGWAISHLTKAGALLRPERGRYVIGEQGHILLTERPAVTRADVEAVTGYRRSRPSAQPSADLAEDVESLDPPN